MSALNAEGHNPDDVLRREYPSGIALEDFTSLSDSLELRIGRAYWDTRGTHAFTRREVPSDITNDGGRAARAAEVLLRNCEEAGCGDIVVLEMGIGLGLFTRLFLRRFAELCVETGRDYFERLQYWATDFSRQNLLDVEAAGTLQEFGPRVRLAELDATRPDTLTPLGEDEPRPTPHSLRAVLHNYLYDALPQSLVLRQEGVWYELRVQTRLVEPWRVSEYGVTSLDEVMENAYRGGKDAVTALSPLYPLIHVERSFFPVSLDQIPFANLIQCFADEELQPHVDRTVGPGRNVRMWVPWGAMTSAQHSMELLAPDGFLLFTDYGASALADVQSARTWQRYGAGITININFPLLGRCLEESGRRVGIPVADDELPLHARLVTIQDVPRTHEAFATSFAAGDFLKCDRHLEAARTALDSDLDKALEHYSAALELFPHNWTVLGELAHVHNFKIDLPAVALRYAESAIALNPSTSADLWCEQGDALYRLNRPAEAEASYLHGTSINSEHGRSYYNVAWMESLRGAHTDAIERIGKALACDPAGTQTPAFLEKQKEIIERRDAAYLADRERTSVRLS